MAEERPLDGRHALVTGGGRGIGAAISEELARLGATVTLTGRSLDALEAQRNRLSGDHLAVAMDVTSDDSVLDGIAKAVDAHGPIQVLVNNAGIAESHAFQDGDIDLWRRAIDVNLLGAVRCIRAILPGMEDANEGRIVNIASTAGLKGYAYVSAYVASKHAVVGLTRSLAIELARTGITVNAVCPGFTDTNLLADSVANIMRQTGRDEEEARQSLARFNPQGRFIQPAEVAAAVAWLCLSSSSSITGQAIAVAGGEVM